MPCIVNGFVLFGWFLFKVFDSFQFTNLPFVVLCKNNFKVDNHTSCCFKCFHQKKKNNAWFWEFIATFIHFSHCHNCYKSWIWSRKHFATLRDPQSSVISWGTIVSSSFIMPSLMSIAVDLYGPLNPLILWLNTVELTAKHFYFHYNTKIKSLLINPAS